MTRGEAACSSKHGFYSSSGFADSLLSKRRAYVLFHVLGVHSGRLSSWQAHEGGQRHS